MVWLDGIVNCSCFCVAEIEALEACTWLRAAGFPQYAQMYEGKAIVLYSSGVMFNYAKDHICMLLLS